MSKINEDNLSKLKMIASIEPGQTFSPSYDTPLDHNIWSTTIWRTYNREDRKKSINYIKSVLDEARLHVESKEMILLALKGLENLKETYKGDYMIIGLINTIIEDYSNLNISIDCDFFDALKNLNYPYIEKYLYDGNNPNIKNNDKQNALHIVSDNKVYNYKIMDMLLNFNIGLTDKDVYGNSPLYYAVTSGCTDAVLKLEEAISKKKRNIVY